MDKYIYAVRNKTTNAFENARCNSGGKYYSRKKFAQSRCDKYNNQGYGAHCSRGEFEVVTFRLIEVKGNE